MKLRGPELFVMRETSAAPAPCHPERGPGNKIYALDSEEKHHLAFSA